VGVASQHTPIISGSPNKCFRQKQWFILLEFVFADYK
jgi:hypothetical protein